MFFGFKLPMLGMKGQATFNRVRLQVRVVLLFDRTHVQLVVDIIFCIVLVCAAWIIYRLVAWLACGV
jgi:hypothetical protein